MNIKQIILEEINDFEWADGVSDKSKINTEEDYVGVWPEFEKMLSDYNVGVIDGVVQSSEYDGDSIIQLVTDKLDVSIEIHMRYDDDKGDSLITYRIYDSDSFYSGDIADGEYWPPRNWLSPVVDELRKIVERVHKR